MTDPKDYKLEFAPGCFDNFEGTQEELDELISTIQEMIKTGEFFEKAQFITIDSLADMSEEELEAYDRACDNFEALHKDHKKKLN